MKIGVLGAGKVALALGDAWSNKGHEVVIGTRRSLQAIQLPGSLRAATLKEAAEFGEVILLAINPWTEIEPVLATLVDTLRGKVIIDVSNNIIFKGRPEFAFTDRSMGEFVQSLVPGAFVVKTLNITPAAMMVDPKASGIVPAIGWVAGNNKEAKVKVTQLVEELGWTKVVDLGGIEQALLQENIGLILSLVVAGFMK